VAGKYALLAFYVVLALGPIAYMAIIALNTADGVEGGPLLPRHINWNSFVAMWNTIDFARYTTNSLIVSVATGVCAAVLSLGAGYVLSRFRFRFRKALLVSFAGTYLFPTTLLILPLYVLIVGAQSLLGITLIGTYFGVVLTYMAFALPFAIWMMTVYVNRLPRELDDAGRIDGASRVALVRYIILPLARPGLAVVFVFSFLLSWNDVLFASVMTNQRTETLGVGIQAFVSTVSSNTLIPLWNELMAASLVSAIPAVMLFMLVQRALVSGLAAGAVKG
jgi:multiple sugar transport system permease protein